MNTLYFRPRGSGFENTLGRPIAKHFAIFAVFQIFAICGFFEGPQKSQKPQVVRSQIFGNFAQTMYRFDEKKWCYKNTNRFPALLSEPLLQLLNI